MTQLKRGWTTGACATAAAQAAFTALVSGDFPDPVTILLPRGARVAFALAFCERDGAAARAGVIKDAGDDPDVTHGALVIASVVRAAPGCGIVFRAGAGVGTVTLPGLPLPPGEPAINPVPRAMIVAALQAVAAQFATHADAIVEISIPGGARIAERTMNGRLGIVGGLSILGTTGIVVPYSCAAWIHSIHRGIDVARAAGIRHVAGSTGATSEVAVRALFDLPEIALIDMGDFVGGMLKYLRVHPVARVTVAGGLAKISKLGQGMLDVHSRRGALDLAWLAGQARAAGGDAALCSAIGAAHTAMEAFGLARAAGTDLAMQVARAAWVTARKPLGPGPVALDVVIFDREGGLLARHDGGQ